MAKKKKRKKGRKATGQRQPTSAAPASRAGVDAGRPAQQAGRAQAGASRSTAQRRAKHALAFVQERARNDDYGKFVPYVKALPAAIIMSGLGQALAMERARSNDPGHEHLYAALNYWLCNKDHTGRNGDGWPSSPHAGSSDILVSITEKDEQAYLRTQMEAMAYLEWLKKFAVALLKDPDAGEEEEAAKVEAGTGA